MGLNSILSSVCVSLFHISNSQEGKNIRSIRGFHLDHSANVKEAALQWRKLDTRGLLWGVALAFHQLLSRPVLF